MTKLTLFLNWKQPHNKHILLKFLLRQIQLTTKVNTKLRWSDSHYNQAFMSSYITILTINKLAESAFRHSSFWSHFFTKQLTGTFSIWPGKLSKSGYILLCAVEKSEQCFRTDYQFFNNYGYWLEIISDICCPWKHF